MPCLLSCWPCNARRRSHPQPAPCETSFPPVYFVRGAMDTVNGRYCKSEEFKNSYPVYRSPSGLILFKYQMPSGSCFWYISTDGVDLSQPSGDYYRTRCTTEHPPEYGWGTKSCPLGDQKLLPSVSAQYEEQDIVTSVVPSRDQESLLVSQTTRSLVFQPKHFHKPPRCSCCELENPSSIRYICHGSTIVKCTDCFKSGGCMQLEVVLVSGASLANLYVSADWTAREVREALRDVLGPGCSGTKFMAGYAILEGSSTLADIGVSDGTSLTAVVQAADIIVEEAGAEKVNGCYWRSERWLNDYPVYANENGLILFKHKMPSGSYFWYISQDDNLIKSDGDYYRTKCKSQHPPQSGWENKACPLSAGATPPTVTCLNLLDDLPDS